MSRKKFQYSLDTFNNKNQRKISENKFKQKFKKDCANLLIRIVTYLSCKTAASQL